MTARKLISKRPAQRPAPSAGAAADDDPLRLVASGLEYVLDRPPRAGHKVAIRVRRTDAPTTPTVRDTVDLLAHRQRQRVAGLVADSLGAAQSDAFHHLTALLDQVERAHAPDGAPEPVTLTPARRAAAERLLRAPDLLDRAARACDALGYVGEERTKRLVFLVAVSRLLPRPLSAVLVAPSAAGKSELLDTVVRLVPAEAVEFLSRLTPAALYYAGPDHLRHKLVVVDEQAGAAESDYAIRTLQTKGFLRQAVPVRGRTEWVEAHGPVALLSGTTRSDLNPENLSRCLELTLDDGPEQTRRVHEAQRRAWAGERPEAVGVEAWQDAQRLLEPGEVVIPYAPRLEYPARTSGDRRGNQKLLTLVAAHAFLAQRWRERDRRERVVARVEDYAVVYGLLRPLVDEALQDLSSRAVAVYRRLAAGDAEHVTRRDVAAQLGATYATARRVLDELVEQELAQPIAREKPLRFRLLDGSLLGLGERLTPPDALG